MIHFDANFTTPPCTAAIEALVAALQNRFLGEVRADKIADFIGATDKDRFIFTGAADSVDLVFWTVYMEVARREGKSHIVTSALEDSPTLQACKKLESLGCTIKIAPVKPNGQIDVAALGALISPRTALISVSIAQSLTGVIQPIEEIAALAKKQGVLLHLDATAALGKMPISFQELGADYLTFAGDRIHAVPSSGGVFVKEGKPIPLAPKQDVPSFFALSAAALQAAAYLDSMVLEVSRLRDHFEEAVLAAAPGAEVLFRKELRLPNTTLISFPGVHQEALLYLLQRKGVIATFGGDYSQKAERLVGSDTVLSFSLSRMTTEEELLRAASIIAAAYQTLKEASVLLGPI